MSEINQKLLEALKTIVTEIDVIEFSEDTAISEEAYSTAVHLIKECEKPLTIPEIPKILAKINFYDLATALKELSNHYGVNRIDYLIEELEDEDTKNIIVEQDGLISSTYIEDGEENE